MLYPGLLKQPAMARSAIAMPTPMANPCPKGPVVASIPAVTPYSGCPGVLEPHCLNAFKSSIVSPEPDKKSSEYKSAQPWPADNMNLSRLYHLGLCGLCFRNLPQSV